MCVCFAFECSAHVCITFVHSLSVCMHTFVCFVEARVQGQHPLFSLITLHLSLLKQGLSLNLEITNQLECVASRIKVPPTSTSAHWD